MAQIPILSGFLSGTGDFAESYPVNLEPVIAETGLSGAYLKRPWGAVQVMTGPGIDRGGINWNGVHYRVMGSKLCRIDGAVVELGDVGNDGLPVTLDYSFDRLSVTSAGSLWYWTGSALVRVSDIDLGVAQDHLFVAGYFMTTDGTSLVVTELADPMAVDPLKYGSSETDPDPVMGLLKLRGEVYALGRHSIDVFTNSGGAGFPFARLGGATIAKGCTGRFAKTMFADSFAFVGGGRNEALAVYQAGGGQAVKLSTRAIDAMLAAEPHPELIRLEAMVAQDEQRLFIHLSDRTLVFCAAASLNAHKPVWYLCRGGFGMDLQYRPRSPVMVGSTWFCGDVQGNGVAVLAESACDFGEAKGCQFDTVCLYNGGKGGIIRSLELVGQPGLAAFGDNPQVAFSISLDGESFGSEQAISTGRFGERVKRVQIRPGWRMRQRAIVRVRAANSAAHSWAGLEIDVEPLNV